MLLWVMNLGFAGGGVAAVVAPQKVRIGAFGLLHGKGKTPIGRGL